MFTACADTIIVAHQIPIDLLYECKINIYK